MNDQLDTSKFSKGRLSAVVMNFVRTMKQTADRGREPGFSNNDWAALGEFIDQEAFVRMGPFHDEKRWADYVELLTAWVTNSDGWTPVAKRINEAPGVVYLDCEEQISSGGQINPFYSLSVYEFNDAGKIIRIDVYAQHQQA